MVQGLTNGRRRVGDHPTEGDEARDNPTKSSRDNHGRRAATNSHSSSTHWQREAQAAEHSGERRDASTQRGGSGERPESTKTEVLECDGRRQQSLTPTDGDNYWWRLGFAFFGGG
ncbi:hypothetical protein S245_029243 [Arachis hypogaea]